MKKMPFSQFHRRIGFQRMAEELEPEAENDN